MKNFYFPKFQKCSLKYVRYLPTFCTKTSILKIKSVIVSKQSQNIYFQ